MMDVELGRTEKWPAAVVVYTDGASRGNPGPASFGVRVEDESGETVYECAKKLGMNTNNFAEYSAVIQALELAFEHKVKQVTLRTDSELLVKQMKGEYKVKSDAIKPLFGRCQELLKKIGKVDFQHVRRENNKRADQLANMALDL